MCIIIHKPAHKKIAKDSLEECWRCNADGVGFAYVDPVKGELVVKKGYMKMKEAIEAILEHEGFELVIHFRRASPGMEVSADMCHPFYCKNGDTAEDPKGKYQLAMVHNGRLEWRHEKDKSDTSCFFEDLIAPLFDRDPYFLEYDYGREMMRRTVTTPKYETNKLVFMRYDVVENKTDVVIINPQLGYLEDECWYSNLSYKVPKYAKSYYGDGAGFCGTGTSAGLPFEDGWAAGGELHHSEYMKLWSTPDQNGWKWDFKRHGWVNIATHAFAWELQSRQVIPYDNKYYKEQFLKAEAERERKIQLSAFNSGGKKKKKGGAFDHLDAHEITAMARIADGLLIGESDLSKREIKKLGNHDKIIYLRNRCRAALVNCKNMEDEFLDMYMVAGIKEGKLVEEINLAENEAAFDAAAQKEIESQMALQDNPVKPNPETGFYD